MFRSLSFWILIFGSGLITAVLGTNFIFIPLTAMALNILLEHSLLNKLCTMALTALVLYLQPILMPMMLLLTVGLLGFQLIFGNKLLAFALYTSELALSAMCFMLIPSIPIITVAAAVLATLSGLNLAILAITTLVNIFRAVTTVELDSSYPSSPVHQPLTAEQLKDLAVYAGLQTTAIPAIKPPVSLTIDPENPIEFYQALQKNSLK
jgi:hypothetical protein